MMRLGCAPELFGGYPGAERAVACFNGTEQAPVACIEIIPKSEKFAEELSHRDILGALMSLGIKRETLGDILVDGKKAYLFCLTSISEFICAECVKIRHTDISCKVISCLPDICVRQPEESEYVVASERLDCIISAVYDVPRSESREYFFAKTVFVNGRLTENESYTPDAGDIVSVRGKGRFVYKGIARTTKKNKLRISAAVYK